MVEVVTGQTPLPIVHCKTLLVKVDMALTFENGLVLFVITALPTITLQVPVPTTGILALKLVVFELAHNVCDAPAFEREGKSSRTILTVDVVAGHTPLDMVH